MSSRASAGAAAAALIAAAVVGVGGGAILGNLGAEPEAAAGDGTASQAAAAETPTPAASITLRAARTTVAANERIDLTGALEPAAGGIELKVERSLDGSQWDSFPDADDQVTVTTTDDGTFSTYVVTGRSGENQFRLVGQVGGEFLESAPVTVTVG